MSHRDYLKDKEPMLIVQLCFVLLLLRLCNIVINFKLWFYKCQYT